MHRIVVAAKAGADQPWLADAAAELSHQTGAAVSVVSPTASTPSPLPVPRSEFREPAQAAVDGFLERLARRRRRRPRATSAPAS